MLAETDEDLRAFLKLLAKNLEREGDTLEQSQNALQDLLDRKAVVDRKAVA